MGAGAPKGHDSVPSAPPLHRPCEPPHAPRSYDVVAPSFLPSFLLVPHCIIARDEEEFLSWVLVPEEA